MKKIYFLFISCIVLFIHNTGRAQFYVYNTGNSGLSDNFCWYINADVNEEIWVGTYTGGLNRASGAGWIVYNTSNSGIGANYITQVIFDQQGNTWAGSYTGSGGLSKFTGSSWTVYTSSNSGIGNNDIMS